MIDNIKFKNTRGGIHIESRYMDYDNEIKLIRIGVYSSGQIEYFKKGEKKFKGRKKNYFFNFEKLEKDKKRIVKELNDLSDKFNKKVKKILNNYGYKTKEVKK
jgi:hypothetical protein